MIILSKSEDSLVRTLVILYPPLHPGVVILFTPLHSGIVILFTPLHPCNFVLFTPLHPCIFILFTPLYPCIVILLTPLQPCIAILLTPLQPCIIYSYTITTMHRHIPYTIYTPSANSCGTSFHGMSGSASSAILLIHLFMECPGLHHQPYYWCILSWYVQSTTVSPIVSFYVFFSVILST